MVLQQTHSRSPQPPWRFSQRGRELDWIYVSTSKFVESYLSPLSLCRRKEGDWGNSENKETQKSSFNWTGIFRSKLKTCVTINLLKFLSYFPFHWSSFLEHKEFCSIFAPSSILKERGDEQTSRQDPLRKTFPVDPVDSNLWVMIKT